MRDALVGADTVLDIWREPLSDLAHSHVAGRPPHRARHRRARPPAAARRARRPGAADRGDRGVRRPAPRRGPAADGHRLRAAGRRPRLPAPGRPRALPGGLPRHRLRARQADGRAARATRRPACSASWSSRATTSSKLASLPRAMRRGRTLILIGFAAFLFLGFSALLARALTGAGDERAQVLDAARGPGRRRRGRRAGRAARLPRRSRPAPRSCATRVAELQRDGRVEILNYTPSVQVALTRPHRGRARRLARGRLPARRPVRPRAPRRPADRRRRRAALDLGPDRQRGGLHLRTCPRLRLARPDATRPADSPCSRSPLFAPPAAQAADTPTARPLRGRARGPLPDGGRRGCSGSTPPTAASASATTARRARPGWSTVQVPHAWNVGDDSVASMNGSVGWYRKDFELPDARPRARLGGALRVGQLPRARLAQRPRGRLPRGAYLPFTVPLQGLRARRQPARGARRLAPHGDRPPARPRQPDAPGCPPAAGGTTAASCARSTSRRSTRWPSSPRS